MASMDVVTALLTLLHLGGLPRTEQGLVYALALGPFLVLGIVILVRRPPEEPSHGAPEEAADGAPEGEREDRREGRREDQDPEAGLPQRER
jgi:hypothetical protein